MASLGHIELMITQGNADLLLMKSSNIHNRRFIHDFLQLIIHTQELFIH